MRLKKFYTSREVAALTGLSARQLQWWDSRRVFTAARATQRTEAGGFTERRYTTLDVLELQVLADLRRRGFSIPRLRRLLTALRDVFGIRLYETIGDGGPNDVVGHTVVVHAKADDLKTDPAGNSGDRIACGVVTVGGGTPTETPLGIGTTGTEMTPGSGSTGHPQ